MMYSATPDLCRDTIRVAIPKIVKYHDLFCSDFLKNLLSNLLSLSLAKSSMQNYINYKLLYFMLLIKLRLKASTSSLKGFFLCNLFR